MTSPEGSEVHPFECGKLDTGWKIYQVMISKNYSFLMFFEFMKKFFQNNEELPSVSALPKQTLPTDKLLPPVIREIVSNAPSSRKLPAFIASLAPLCALCPRIRLQYPYDTRPSALLLQVLIEGEQSSGKSFAADIEDLIMGKTLKARDKHMRRMEQEYREKKKRRKANEKLEEEPQTTVCVVPPTISKTVLTKRADMFERVLGDTLTFWMFAEELAQVTDAGKQGYSNLRTIMRNAYDLGSLFGIDFASDNSYSAIVDINICSMFCATPAAVDEYYDRKSIEGGNVTRCVVCQLPEMLGEEGAIFKPYTDKQRALVDAILRQLMNETFADNGLLKPVIELDMKWLSPTICKWVKDKADEAKLSGNKAIDVFRKRSSVSAFRVASLCYHLYQHDDHRPRLETIQKRVRQIYLFMAEYILQGMLKRWGNRYIELSTKRELDNKTNDKPILFNALTDVFTRDQLKLQIEKQGLTTPARIFLYQWKMMKVIESVDNNTFRKIQPKATLESGKEACHD